jgi:hypothetical protein
MSEKSEKSFEVKVERWWKGLDVVSLVCIVALGLLYQDYLSLTQKMQVVQSG